MTHAEVQLRDNGLIAPLTRGETYFNYHWLRDACPTTIDPQTRERVFDVTSLKASPSARSARIADDARSEIRQLRAGLRRFRSHQRARNFWASLLQPAL